MQLTFSLTVIRFVNGLLEEQQKQQDFSHSLTGLASMVGLPLELVSARHRATHAQLPHLDDLREDARTILHWLQGNYWLPSCSTTEATLSHLKLAFVSYAEMRSSKSCNVPTFPPNIRNC